MSNFAKPHGQPTVDEHTRQGRELGQTASFESTNGEPHGSPDGKSGSIHGSKVPRITAPQPSIGGVK